MSDAQPEVQLELGLVSKRSIEFNGAVFDVEWDIPVDLSRPAVDISHSELKVFERCQGKWALKYGRDLRSRKTKPRLMKGGLFHEALNDLHNPLEETPLIERNLVWFKARTLKYYTARIEAGEEDPKSQVKADLLELCRVYMEAIKQPMRVFAATEVDFKIPIFRLDRSWVPVWFAGFIHGRLDVVEQDGSKLWICDFKTKKRFKMKGLEYDAQASIYDLVGAKIFGRDFGGFKFCFIRTPASKRSMNYALIPLRKTDAERRFTENNIAYQMMRMAHAKPTELSWNFTDNCGWDCDFLTACLIRRTGGNSEGQLASEFVVQAHEREDESSEVPEEEPIDE